MTTTSRAFVFASLSLFEHYHRRRKEIEREWPACALDVESWRINALMRKAAHQELREEVADRISLGDGGTYPIAI